MPNSETPLMQSIRLEVGGRPGTRVFRNTVGMADLADGSRRPYGLCEGSSDLIGWKSVVITPSMVGKRAAVFLAIEVKKPGGRTDPKRLAKQRAFVEAVQHAGGLAGMAESIQEANRIVDAF